MTERTGRVPRYGFVGLKPGTAARNLPYIPNKHAAP